MWIPTQYVVLFVAILLLESAALFTYTLIGLVKQNPLPWLIPPHPDFSMCQYGHDGSGQIVRGGPQPQGAGSIVNEPAMIPAASFQVVTSTTVVLQTSMLAPQVALTAPVQFGAQGMTVTSANAGAVGALMSDFISTVTASATAISSGTTSTSSVSLEASSTTSQSASSNSQSQTDSTTSLQPASTVTITSALSSSTPPPGTSTITANSSSSGTVSPQSTTSSASPSTHDENVVTRQATLTSWVSASEPPRSTSTTLLVVTASA